LKRAIRLVSARLFEDVLPRNFAREKRLGVFASLVAAT
jgi:hypothetical protein